MKTTLFNSLAVWSRSPARLLVALAVGTVVAPSWAADDIDFNNLVRANAQKLIQGNRPNDATTYLTQNLRGTQNREDRMTDVGLQLCRIAFDLRQNRNFAQAKAAAATVIAVADSLLVTPKTSPAQGQLFTKVGLLCELVLHDRGFAEKYYLAAMTADPNQVQARDHLASVQKKRASKSNLDH